MNFTIQQADFNNTTDSYNLIKILNDYAESPMGGNKPLSNFSRKNLINTLRERNDCLALLTYTEHEAVGLLIGFEGFSTFYCKPLLNIHDIFVVDTYRGKGISQLLLQHAEKIALSRQYCKLTLEVLNKNEPAMAAYKKFGFNAYQLDPEAGQALFWEKKLD